jgi:hypothetical protein
MVTTGVGGKMPRAELAVKTFRVQSEVVPFVVEFEVAVPRLTPAFW